MIVSSLSGARLRLRTCGATVASLHGCFMLYAACCVLHGTIESCTPHVACLVLCRILSRRAVRRARRDSMACCSDDAACLNADGFGAEKARQPNAIDLSLHGIVRSLYGTHCYGLVWHPIAPHSSTLNSSGPVPCLQGLRRPEDPRQDLACTRSTHARISAAAHAKREQAAGADVSQSRRRYRQLGADVELNRAIVRM